jgi:formamidopyrimidine-DNA glycosylase
MPELPEVETTRRGIEPHLRNQTIDRVILRNTRLRWPISEQVASLAGRQVIAVTRRGKYLLMQLDQGHLIWHLGMSGSMRILPESAAAQSHEHVEIKLSNGLSLKYRDPRRFGALLYSELDPLQHRLLINLGPEPLENSFTAEYLYQCCRSRKAAIKLLIMNSHIVVGVGNIYASEALFQAGIRPALAARRISKTRCVRLVDSIRDILTSAIAQGGTTLQDFTQADGNPGYFTQSLQVYGNKGSCHHCGTSIKHLVQGQRSSYYCPLCQS